MPTAKKSFIAVGTIVVDYHKVVKHYPNERASARICKEILSTGGAPLNVLINLAKLGTSFELILAGRIGRDLDGKFIIEECDKHNINHSQITQDKELNTGYTDVYTVESTSRHTCFHYDGAGQAFCRDDVSIDVIENATCLFLGSLGALGKMDDNDPEIGCSQSTKLIRDAKKRGLITILEFAPLDHGTTIHEFAGPLKETDYVIINDRTAEVITEQAVYAEDNFDPELARKAALEILKMGVRRGVIIQSSASAIYLGADDTFIHKSGYYLPWKERISSAGVDHAFCAGFIKGLLEEDSMTDCLNYGLACSTVCRRDLTPSGGLKSLDECLDICNKLRQPIMS
ncbi:carbohydrate kinase family protein [Cerasicoccus frondis]|uniref:carbohydrate kinase family protein n=1 Tax=Cerasicoccus frondis TaxID=490090 RepID=UPI0028527A82|nr:carbohydrate kinase family protein [Cerasicoccus frondis]